MILTPFASETHIFMTVIGTVMRPRTIHDSEAFGSCPNYFSHVSVNQLCKHSKRNIDFPEKDKFLQPCGISVPHKNFHKTVSFLRCLLLLLC